MTGIEAVKAIEIISKFKEQIVKSLGIAVDEVKQFFDNGVENYLSVQFQKYSFTKTFLYRETPVEFYNTFFPIQIKSKLRTVATDNITQFLGNNQFVGIVGAAGSGKTMLMKHVFLSAFNQTFKIPIVVELRNLNTYDGTFSAYLSEVILENKLALNDNILKRLFANGSFIFLLDGYDELFSERKDILTEEIDRFIDTNNKNHFLVSSRPGANIESLPRFSFYHVQPLSTREIAKFIDLQIQHFEDKTLMKKIKEIVLQHQNRDFLAFVTNPLLLSMYILTYSDHPELPKLKSTFYYNVYDTLATKHDTITKRGGYQHERHSGLQKDEIFTFLKFFSVQSLFAGDYSFDDLYFTTLSEKLKASLKYKFDKDKLLYDLLVSINVFLRDGSLITYPHKSLQEYLAAACIASQNIEFKLKVYREKLKRYFVKAKGGMRNFWDLLFELDKEQLVKEFLTPNVNSTIEYYKFRIGMDHIDLAKTYLKLSELSHTVTVSNNKLVLTGEASVNVDMELDISLMLTNSWNKFIDLEEKDVIQNTDLLLRMFEAGYFIKTEEDNEEYYISYKNFPELDLIDFLKNSSLTHSIYTMFESIEKTFHQVLNEIEEENKSKILILE